MKIGSILENQEIEKRIAITPEVVKKYKALGFDLYLNENYGTHLGINTSPGDYSEEVIPDPIPNSEVKLFSADGTLS